MQFLEIDDVHKDFGGVHALAGVSMQVDEASVLGLIGPNGSGKSTLLNVIAGFYKPTRGAVKFRGDRIDGHPPHRIVQLGIAKTHQIPQPFLDMTARENLAVSVMYGVTRVRNVNRGLEEADRILSYLGMSRRADVPTSNLTVQEKKRLELGKALATGAKILLLDEIFAGLSTSELSESMDLFSKLQKELGFTAVVVEHVMRAVLGLSNRVVVLVEGRKIVEGSPDEIVRDNRVIEAYVGTRSDVIRT